MGDNARMRYQERNLGVSTADAEDVCLRFDSSELILSFTDWQAKHQELCFADVLAFRFEELDEASIRDDTTYEVLDSPWLARQAELQAVSLTGLAHYKLCFNACGALDVLCRRFD
jgi:hypothetical protein